MAVVGKKSYAEKLKDPRWQRMRLQILERDEWTCQECRDTEETLHVHHRYYLRDAEPWDYPPSALVTLCAICHEGAPDSQREALDCFLASVGHWGHHPGLFYEFALAFDEGRPPDQDIRLSQADWLWLRKSISALLQMRVVGAPLEDLARELMERAERARAPGG